MNWLNICQGLVLLGLIARFVNAVFRAIGGAEVKPSGGLGVFVAIVWYALALAVAVRSGALNTIVGYP